MRIGVDTGGTFTDCVLMSRGRARVVKVFSGPRASPDAAAQVILDGVRRVARTAAGPLEILHGTTVGTNSLLERRGARVGLITTAGFEDLMEIGRQARSRLYDLNVQRGAPLVAREFRWGLRERTAAGGRILLRPLRREIERLKRELRKAKIESIALSFLFSFANPSNERRVARALGHLGLPISASHVILPEFREYERTSTTVINAFLVRHVGAYLERLARGIERVWPPRRVRPKPRAKSRVFIMQSSGGITTARRAAAEPVRTILSAPAGGVAASAWLQKQLRIPRAISFDMGGTSTDVCLIDGVPRTAHETRIGGLPVAVQALDVHSVGAGGGSLARIDSGGALRVGPESAGAAPGPVCYGSGGTGLTVADANLILGRLDPEHFLGGTFRLDSPAAERAFARFLRGQRSGAAAFKSPVDLARGIIEVANANMAKALRVISVERGSDPRNFTLISFGGAGGLHAAALARALGMPRVIVPSNPGAFSALGLLLSDITQDVSRSVLLKVPQTERFGAFLRKLEREFGWLERTTKRAFQREHGQRARIKVERDLGVRYTGQSYELLVPYSANFPADFARKHLQMFDYKHDRRQLEIVSLRLRVCIQTPKPGLRRRGETLAKVHRPVALKRKPVWFAGRFHPTPFFDRDGLPAGASIPGPAVVTEYSSTTVVPPDFGCRVDEYLNLELTPDAR